MEYLNANFNKITQQYRFRNVNFINDRTKIAYIL